MAATHTTTPTPPCSCRVLGSACMRHEPACYLCGSSCVWHRRVRQLVGCVGRRTKQRGKQRGDGDASDGPTRHHTGRRGILRPHPRVPHHVPGRGDWGGAIRLHSHLPQRVLAASSRRRSVVHADRQRRRARRRWARVVVVSIGLRAVHVAVAAVLREGGGGGAAGGSVCWLRHAWPHVHRVGGAQGVPAGRHLNAQDHHGWR